MSNIPQVNEASPATADRRAHPREKVSALAYVDLGPANGGLLLNLSEGGLALATATRLVGEKLSGIRVELPDLPERIEVCGRVVWRAESKKEAGIKFVDLSADAAESIKTWIATQELAETQKDAKQEPVVEPAATFDVTDPALRPRERASQKPIAQSSGESVFELTHATDAEGSAGVTESDLNIGSPAADRRAHPRGTVNSLAYVDLGLGNGGRLINLSESGLALTAVVKVMGNSLEHLRFELPNFEDWVEARARIVWRSEAEKQAGVQFEGLSPDALAKIRNWVLTESGYDGSSAIAARVDGIHEAAGQQVIADSAERLASARPTRSVDAVPAAFTTDTELRSILGRGEWGTKETPAVTGAKNLTTFAAITALVAVISFVTGIAIERRIRQRPAVAAKAAAAIVERAGNIGNAEHPLAAANEAPGLVQTESQRGHPSEGSAVIRPADQNGASTAAPSASKTKEATQKAILPGRTQKANEHPKPSGNLVSKQAATLPKQRNPLGLRASVPMSSGSTAAERSTDAPHRTDVAAAKADVGSASSQPSSTTKGPAEPGTAQSPPPVTAITTGASSPAFGAASSGVAPNGTTPTETRKEIEKLSSAPMTPTNAVAVKPSITITMAPFPSLRIPPQSKPASAGLGKSLEIGRLVSRAQPEYPTEALSQRIEGTVKVHATIGRDGAIQSIVASGPHSLAEAAKKAVQQWHYKPTLLGGQPIEGDQDIVVVFRLSAQPTKQN
jgi:TonB family protein